MKVKALIRLPQTRVTPDTPILKVWRLLARRDITLLPVVSDKNILEGVIGEDDLLYRIVPDYREYFSEFIPDAPELSDLEELLEKDIEHTAKHVMNKKVITINYDQPIFKALSKMMVNRVRVLPVIDDDNKYLGMVIEDDIMTYLLKMHEHLVKKRK